MLVRIFSLSLCLLATGCAHHLGPAVPFTPPAHATDAPLDISIAAFSTFMSEAGKRACQSLNKRQACVEDAISPEQFFTQWPQLPYFSNAYTSVTGTDYQLLIANHATAPVDENSITPVWTVTELTLLWRGLEIHSTRIAQFIEPGQSGEDSAAFILHEWWQRVQAENIFTLPYLYRAVGASDYINHMRLPATVGEFFLTDTELSPDPFDGVFSRYRHPRFDDAYLDVAVFPIQDSLTMPKLDILRGVLRDEIHSAEQVAQAQAFELNVIKPFHVISVDGINVAAQALQAQQLDEEPLFATTFAFIQEDKVIKISTNFPLATSTPLVKRMVPSISVPKESQLLQAIRQIISQSTAPPHK